MTTFLIFIAVLAVLVLSHEFGHFIAARRSGMRVYEFGFGFAPRLFGLYRDPSDKKIVFVWGRGKKKKEEKEFPSTLYSFNLLPLGGFVKIKGENGDEAGADSFGAKPAWKRAITLASGVTMNVALAFILLSIGFGIGLPQMTDELPANLVENPRVQIMQVLSGKPAEKAGLKMGDTVVRVGTLEHPRLKELQTYVDEHKAETIEVAVERGGEIIKVEIKPVTLEETGKGALGIAIAEIGKVKYPWYQAIYHGFIATGLYLKEIVFAFYIFIKGLILGRGGAEAVAGPVGIAVMTGQAAKLGLAYLIQFTALLSLNLAIINALPIPALDGGRLLFLAINKMRGKAIAIKYEQWAHLIGFALLMMLVLAVTVKDLSAFRGVFGDLIDKARF